MNMHPEGEFHPIIPSPLAIAIERRRFMEVAEDAASRVALGVPLPLSDPLIVESQINRKAIDREKLLQSRGNLMVMRALILNQAYVRFGDLSDEMSPSPREEDALSQDHRARMTRNIGENVTDAVIGPVVMKAVERFEKELTAAEAIAGERGVSPAAVYEDDALYGDLVRRIGTPAESAEQQASVLENLTMDTVIQTILFQMREGIILDLKNRGISDEDIENGQAIIEMLLLADIGDGEQVQRTAYETIENTRKITYRSIARKVEKYWGKEGLESLSEEVKAMVAQYGKDGPETGMTGSS